MTDYELLCRVIALRAKHSLQILEVAIEDNDLALARSVLGSITTLHRLHHLLDDENMIYVASVKVKAEKAFYG